ncbi:MAG TPA: SRPBCC family protein [Polyangiaceae bacterium]|nr:SRPBCC family protein [Polyangiaceae bacterium]
MNAPTLSIRREAGATHLETEQTLPRPLSEVFPFFADAFNLEKLTPPFLSFSIIGTEPIEMRVGALIDYRLRLHGLPFRWRTAITAWEPPYRFVDEQLRGPYRLWRHEHRFTAKDGETVVSDHVTYKVPGGALIDRLFVERDVVKIFGYRFEALERWVTSGTL